MIEENHSKCQSLLGYLSDFVDGELNPELCEEIEKHIAECQNCHIVVDTLRRTVSLYHETAAEPAEIPNIVRERLYRTLNLEDFTHR